jgi:8-oxo-dGTP diphosphatase
LSEYKKDAHCSYCGQAFVTDAGWPRRCGRCGNESYRNPTPVAVPIQPTTSGGVIVVRRGIAPEIGKLCLPGGYVDYGETWEQAAARELREEAGVIVPSDSFRLFRVRNSTNGGVMMVLGIGKALDALSLPPFVPNEEATERLIVYQPTELAFSSHTEALSDWFASARR